MLSREMEKLIARYNLAETIGQLIQYKELIPSCIYNATMNYLGDGCKSRAEYENMVIFYMDNTYYRNLLLEV